MEQMATLDKLVVIASNEPDMASLLLEWIDLTNDGGWANQFIDEIGVGVYDKSLSNIMNAITRRQASIGVSSEPAMAPTTSIRELWPIGSTFSYQDGRRTRISQGTYKVTGYEGNLVIATLLIPGVVGKKRLRVGTQVSKMNPMFFAKVPSVEMCSVCGTVAVLRPGDTCSDCRYKLTQEVNDRAERASLAKAEAAERAENEALKAAMVKRKAASTARRTAPAEKSAPVAAPVSPTAAIRRRIRGIQRG